MSIYEKRFRNKLKKIKKQGERYKKEKEIRDTYAEYWPDRKKRKVSNIMLVIIVIAIIGYVVVSFWLQYRTGVPVDSTLTTCWFSFWGAEIISLAAIRTSKEKYKNNESCD